MSTRIIRLIHPYDVNSMICMISFYILPQCRVIFTITTWITFQSTVAVFMLTRGHRHSWYRKFRNISWILVLFFIRCSILKRPNFLFENFEACSAASPRALWKAGCFPTLILIFNQIRICLCSCATMNSATVQLLYSLLFPCSVHKIKGVNLEAVLYSRVNDKDKWVLPDHDLMMKLSKKYFNFEMFVILCLHLILVIHSTVQWTANNSHITRLSFRFEMSLGNYHEMMIEKRPTMGSVLAMSFFFWKSAKNGPKSKYLFFSIVGLFWWFFYQNYLFGPK